jgi:hypothetical protein
MLSNPPSTTFSFQRAFQILNKNLSNSNATLTQRINTQQVQINLLQTQVNNAPSIGGVVTKATLGLDNVDNTSDYNKQLSKATSDALELKQDLLQDADNKRLPQSHVQGLADSLGGKQPTITTSAKISMDKISDPYFDNIQTSASKTTTTLSSHLGPPSLNTYTNSLTATTASTISGSIGSIVHVALASTNITTSNTTMTDVLYGLPSGTWSGCVQVDLTKGANYTWGTTVPCRVQINFSGTLTNTGDFFTTRNNQQSTFITNNATSGIFFNIPVIFRSGSGSENNKLQVFITAPISLISGATANQANNTQRITLTLTKIAL